MYYQTTGYTAEEKQPLLLLCTGYNVYTTVLLMKRYGNDNDNIFSKLFSNLFSYSLVLFSHFIATYFIFLYFHGSNNILWKKCIKMCKNCIKLCKNCVKMCKSSKKLPAKTSKT